MYLSYFGFAEAPFSIAPDPRYLFHEYSGKSYSPAAMTSCLFTCMRSRIVAPSVAAAWLRFGVIATHKTGPPLPAAI